MVFEFITQTSEGTPESLREPVTVLEAANSPLNDGNTQQLQKIAFTLTPISSRLPTSGYDPVVRWVQDFSANAEEMGVIEWDWRLRFDTYDIRHKKCVLGEGNLSSKVPPGHFVSIQQTGTVATWSSPKVSCNYIAAKQLSIMVKNDAWSAQRVALVLREPDPSIIYNPIVAYHPLQSGKIIITPTELLLQAYVVNELEIEVGSILTPEHRTRPLLPATLSCDALPLSSTWTLSQSADGSIRLQNGSQPDLGFSSIETKVDMLTKSIADVQSSVTRAYDHAESGHQILRDVQRQLSSLRKAARQAARQAGELAPALAPNSDNIPKLQAQSEQLVKSFGQTQEYLVSVQKFLENTKQQVAGLDRKLPAIETKTDELAETFAQTQDRILIVQGTLTTTEGRVAGLDRRLTVVEGNSERMSRILETDQEASSPVLFPREPSVAPIPSPELLDNELPKLPVFGRS